MEQEISALFNRLKRQDFAYFLKTWGKLNVSDFVDSPELIEKISRKDFAQKAVALCKKKKLQLSDIHNLDLIYIQKYSHSKLWTVFKFEKIAGSTWTAQEPQEFSDNLEEQLKLFYDTNVCVRLQNQAYWLRVSVKESKIGRKTAVKPSIIYLVHHPRTEYIMVANLKVGHHRHLIQSLLTVLNCNDAVQLDLKGRHLDSLMQLAVNKHSQGSFSAYRLCQVDENPLQVAPKRKRDKPLLSDDEDEDNIDIVFENQAEKDKRLKLVDDTFGSDPLPILEKVEYRLETKFKGTAYAPAMAGEIFHCKVKFEGSNVLEGIRNLGRSGLAEMPMKDHLGKVHSMATNLINLRVKKSKNTTVNATTASE